MQRQLLAAFALAIFGLAGGVPVWGQSPALGFSTTFSGYGGSAAHAVAYDPDGSIFVAGYTEAMDYPVVAPGRLSGGGVDAVVMKLAPGGSRVVWSTYLGGKAEDRALALAPDGLGGVYVAGFTTSTNFPTLNARQSALKGARDLFLARFSATGALAFSTLLGGVGSETAYALASNTTGVWVAGVTDSTDFPTLAARQAASRGRQDGFFSRFTPTGLLVSSSYIGAAGDDIVRCAALAPDGSLVLGGGTDSPDWGFPSGPQRNLQGDQDGFVVKFDASGAVQTGGSYLGGTGGLWTTQETVYALAVAPAGQIWAGGATPSRDFPRNSSWRTVSTDLQDAYLVQFDAGLTSILVSSLVGGTQREGVLALATDADGTLFASGYTTSPDFPAVLPTQSVCGGSRDAFLLRWPRGYPAPDFSTCLGGRGSDTAQALAARTGSVAVAGISDSSNFPQLLPLQSLVGSTAKVFVTEYRNMKSSGMMLQLNSPSPASGQGGARVFRFSASHLSGASLITQVGLAVSPDATLKNACAMRYVPATGRVELADAAGSFTTGVRLRSADVASNLACTIYGSGAAAASSGNTLEVTVPVLFQAAFAGSKNLLVFAQGGASLGPTSKGSWTVPAGGSPASVVSVQPPAASGAGGVFTVQVVDAQGAADLSYGYLLINKTYDTAASCTVVVDHQWKVLYLGNDQMTAWLTVGLGENKTVENSQCRVKGATSKMTLAGSMATYQLDLQFTSRNSGVNTLWADAVDKGGAGLGYGAYGSYDVKIPVATLSLPSPSPASGQGNVERFRFTADHTSGAALVTESAFSISPGSTPAGGCTVRFVSSSGLLQLADSTGAYKWSVRPGTTDVAAGPVCTLYGAGSSVVKSGTAVNSTVALVFPATFAGAKFLLQSATGGTTLPWQVQGNWTVLSGTAPPGVLRMAPSAPNGTRIIVDLILADAQGVTDLAFGYGLIHSALANPNGCMFLADRAWKAVYLLNDAGTAWTSAFLGENKVLENSQCRIFPATSTQATLGNALRYSIDIAFKPGFAGEKKVWASAVDAGMVSSGWIEFGAFQAQ